MNPDLIANLEIIGLVLVGLGSWTLIAFKLFPLKNRSHLPFRIGLSGIVVGILTFIVGIVMALSFT